MTYKPVTVLLAAGLLVSTITTSTANTVLGGDWFVDFPRSESANAASTFEGKLGKPDIRTQEDTKKTSGKDKK